LDLTSGPDNLSGVPFASPHAPGATVLAVIPARIGASRLPRKPLRLLGGAPIIARVWERVIESGVAERVIVATDSDEVADALRQRGAEVAMTSADHPSGTDRVAEVAARPENRAYGIVVNVQGDEPFVRAEAIAAAVGLVRDGGFAIGTCATPASPGVLANPDVVKVVCDDTGRALYFSRAPIPWLLDGADAARRDALVRQHVGLYACSREALHQWVSLPVHDLEHVERLEQLRPLAAGIAIGVRLVEAAPLGGIDTEDDLARANALWDDLYAGRP
jgi:3-deoxy-manno-octulosonate cytidylyltransferase (CMP-KDO synthetase)